MLRSPGLAWSPIPIHTPRPCPPVQTGIEKGAAWQAALQAASEVGAQQFLLSDRPIEITDKRLGETVAVESGACVLLPRHLAVLLLPGPWYLTCYAQFCLHHRIRLLPVSASPDLPFSQFSPICSHLNLCSVLPCEFATGARLFGALTLLIGAAIGAAMVDYPQQLELAGVGAAAAAALVVAWPVLGPYLEISKLAGELWYTKCCTISYDGVMVMDGSEDLVGCHVRNGLLEQTSGGTLKASPTELLVSITQERSCICMRQL